MSQTMIKKCLIIGYPVAHSFSPLIHQAGYKSLNIEDQYSYEALEVITDDLANFVDRIKKQHFHGISITIPHKETIMNYLDEIDPVAEEIGAVNTVLNKDGKLCGYNTDYIGVIKPLKKLIDPKAKKAAVIGAGGAAKAFVYALKELGADVTIYNRTPSTAAALAKQFKCSYSTLENQTNIKQCAIVCNASSIGLAGSKTEGVSPVDQKYLTSHQIVFDAVYRPLKTELIKNAESAGAKIILGVEMLLYQAFAQFKYFTGQDAPEAVMRKSLTDFLNAN